MAMEQLQIMDDLKTTVSSLKECLQRVKAQADSVSARILSGELLPSDLAEGLTQALKEYQILESRFREMEHALPFCLGTKLSDIEAAIVAFEEKFVRIKGILLDYFRLNTEEADAKRILEQTKLALVEKCAASPGEVDLALYELVVSSARNKKADKEEFKRIMDVFGLDLAYAAGYGQLYLDEAIDVSKYIASIPLFNEECEDTQDTPPEEEQDKPDVVLSKPEFAEKVAKTIRRWEGFGGYVSDLTVHLADVQEKTSLAELKALQSENQYALAALWNAANEKLISINNSAESELKVLSPDVLNLLRDRGFLAEITLSGSAGTRRYLTLSTKGWDCFANANMRKYLADCIPPFALPEKLCITPGDWTPLFAARAALLHEHFGKNDRRYILWKWKSSDMALAKPTNEPNVTVMAGLFMEQEEDASLEEMANVLTSLEDNGAALILVRRLEDIAILAQELSSRTETSASYAVEGKGYALFDAAGASVVLPDEEAEPTPEETTQKADISLEGVAPEKPPKMMISAVNKLKTDTPSAKTFKRTLNDVNRFYNSVYTILPLLTHFGILTREQICRFGSLMVHFASEEQYRENAKGALEFLSAKGLLAHYQYENKGETEDAFGLGAFCFGCLSKQDVSSMHKWQPRFGNRNLVCGETIELDTVRQTVEVNELLLEYLTAAKRRFRPSEFLNIKKSVKWSGTSYTAACFLDGAPHACYLLPDYQPLETVSGNAVILRHDLFLNLKHKLLERFENIFVLKDGTIGYYDKAKGEVLGAADNIVDEIDDELDELLAQDELDDLESETEGIMENLMPGTSPEADASAPDVLPLIAEQPEEDTSEAMKAPGTVAKEETVTPAAAPAASPEPSDMSALEETGEPEVTGAPAPAEESGAIPLAASSNRPDLDTPSDEEFCKWTYALLNAPAQTEQALFSAISNALLLSKTASFIEGYTKSARLSRRLQLAANTPLSNCTYSLDDLADAFADATEQDEALTLAAYCFALLTPAKAYDHSLFAQSRTYFEHFEECFPHYPQFKGFFSSLLSVHDVIPTGFTPAVVSLLGNDSETQSYIKRLRGEARGYLNVPNANKQLKALPVLYGNCFGQGSELYDCMSIIADNKTEDLDYVVEVLREYCSDKNGGLVLDSDKIDEKLDAAWAEANSHRKFKLAYGARAQAVKNFKLRLELMRQWVELLSEQKKQGDNLPKLRVLRNKLLDFIAQLEAEEGWKAEACSNVIRFMLHRMKTMLEGNPNPWLFSDLLLTGAISLDSNGMPILNEDLTKVRFNEPWRYVLRHIRAEKKTVSEIKDEILGVSGQSGLFDNLHQLEMLGKWTNSQDEDFIISEAQLKLAADNARLVTEKFRERLELAYTYNQINETEKETLAGIVNQYEEYFYEIGDFACWRQFISGLYDQIEEYADKRQQALRAELELRKNKAPGSVLLAEAERLLEEERNFAVTEEYINRFDTRFNSGESELSDLLDAVKEEDYLSLYIEKEESLSSLCKRNSGRALKSFGWAYLERNLPEKWTSRQRKDSEDLILSWPVRKNNTTPQTIEKLFACLGFNVKSVEKVFGTKEEIFKLTVVPTPRNRADYLHPIAAFGTQMKSPLHVIVLYGNYTEKQLVDTVSSLNLGGISIVLIDRPIDIASKRLIGEIFHTQTSRQNPFLLIDQTLILFLAMHQITERLPALLKCTLPFSAYQPFVHDSGSTPDEMFFGRTKELQRIIDPNGACVVYGGRQLGKTALLQRAESMCHIPESKRYAVYVSILNLDTEAKVVEALSSAITRKTNGAISLPSCDTLKALCDQLNQHFIKGNIVSLHLFIDEVDGFLSAIAKDRYIQIQPLVDLRRQTTNNFKFVIAGLHNVCRAKNATSENGIFGQLGTPLCIKPLSPSEALQLLSRPLRYLGFQIEADRNPQLETILTKTNYYPGILQFFGYMLVETLNNQYAKYYRAASGNPPFTLHDDQLGAVISSTDLNRSIKDKFRWSLELDKRYFMLARCIALLYHYENVLSHGSWLGFSVDEIMEMAKAYDIHCLKNETDHDYVVLLDEMVDMGILSKPGDRPLYRLRRNSFVDIIGENLDVLEADIVRGNEEV